MHLTYNDSMAYQEMGKKKAVKRLDIVRNILEEKGLNPFEGLAEICQERNADDSDYRYGPEIRIPCLKELASYVAPKLRSMEISAEGGKANLGFQIIQFGDMQNGKSIGNNTQHVESGGHGSVQLPVHVHDTNKHPPSTDVETDNSGSSSDSRGESKDTGE